MGRDREGIPVQEKLLITVDEAAEYTHIGTAKIREMMNDPKCGFVLKKGAYSLIKRSAFEKYILSRDVI